MMTASACGCDREGLGRGDAALASYVKEEERRHQLQVPSQNIHEQLTTIEYIKQYTHHQPPTCVLHTQRMRAC